MILYHLRAIAGERSPDVTARIFKKDVEAEFGSRGVSVSYAPPEEHRPRIGEIVALRRKLSDGWCPTHARVN